MPVIMLIVGGGFSVFAEEQETSDPIDAVTAFTTCPEFGLDQEEGVAATQLLDAAIQLETPSAMNLQIKKSYREFLGSKWRRHSEVLCQT